MPKKKPINITCKNCVVEFPYEPRRTLCIDGYKKHTNWIKPCDEEVKFIDDDTD